MKYVSCPCQSNGTIATITPVSPPMTKVTSPPTTNSVGVLKRGFPTAKVALQENTWIPAGTLTAMLAAEKKPIDSVGIDRKRVVTGQRVSVRIVIGGSRFLKQKKKSKRHK